VLFESVGTPGERFIGSAALRFLGAIPVSGTDLKNQGQESSM